MHTFCVFCMFVSVLDLVCFVITFVCLCRFVYEYDFFLLCLIYFLCVYIHFCLQLVYVCFVCACVCGRWGSWAYVCVYAYVFLYLRALVCIYALRIDVLLCALMFMYVIIVFMNSTTASFYVFSFVFCAIDSVSVF